MNTTSAAIYCRISKDRTGEGLGVERQEQACRKLAAERGLTVIEPVYVDNDISAYSGKRRPEYERLVAAIADGQIGHVLAWAPDRLHRSPKELEAYIDASEKHNVQTLTVQSGQWDLSSASGRAVARTLGAWARYESDIKSERLKAQRRQAAEKGHPHLGPRAYGFTADGLSHIPKEAAVIRAAAKAISEGRAVRAVVRDLNQRQVRTAQDKVWTVSQLKKMLTSPRIAGFSEHRGEIVGAGNWEPIIPETLWRAVNATLESRRGMSGGGGGPMPKSLGTGVYVCSVCGQKSLRVSTCGNNNRPAYRCKTRGSGVEGSGGHVSRVADVLDDFIERVVVGRLSEAGLVERIVSADDPEAAEKLRAERREIEKEQENLGVLVGARKITATQMAAATEGLSARIEEINKELTRLGGRSPLAPFANVKPADIPAVWKALPMDQRRSVVDFLAEVRVLKAARGPRFDPASIEVTWKV